MRGLTCVLAVLLVIGTARAERPHVYLIVVDGLDARFATPVRMPRLFDLAVRAAERTSVFAAAHAVMPTRTNPNHVSLLTGAYASAHGITGNAHWRRMPEAPAEKLDDPALIEVETLFTVASETAPELETVGVFGKPKVAHLFAAVAGRQRAPDVLWSAEQASPAGRDPTTGYSFDSATIGALLLAAADREPNLAVVNLSDVDRAAHGHGPDSEECGRAIAGADAAIGRLVDQLRALGRWDRSVLIVTADHGFTDLAPTAERPYPVISFGRDLLRAEVTGIHVVADGGIEHVYADGLAADASEVGDAAARLARVAEVAHGVPGITEVLARLPVAGVPSLETLHADWHLGHPRSGELLLVAAPGYEFLDPFDQAEACLRGNHGGPGEATVPLVVSGGSERLTRAPAGTPPPSAVDVAPTIATLLGLRPPRRVDGTPVAADETGHAIAAVLR